MYFMRDRQQPRITAIFSVKSSIELTPNLPIYAACTPIAGGEIVGLVNPGAFKTMRLLTEFWDPEGINRTHLWA